MRNVRVVAVLAAGILVACGSNTTGPTTTGTIIVHVNATGTSVDTLFTVTVDGSYTYSITPGADQTFQVDSLSHSIALTDVADNCKVTSTNPQVIQIAPGSQATLTFDVSCSTNGDVAVTIATTGDNQDDQYLLDFNSGFYAVPVGPRQTLTVSLPVGSYSIALTGVASNCAVQGANPVSVDIVEDSTATARFDVACTAP
jgi:hypothetical protein